MEIKDVVSFETFEKYIQSKDIFCPFENQLLQNLGKVLFERQLFFLIHDSSIPSDISWLLQTYHYKVNKKYSKHQGVYVARDNPEGDIWMKRYHLNQECWDIFPGVLEEGKDYQVLYQDSSIQIIIFFLRMQKYLYDVNSSRYHVYENGYYVKPEREWDILPYDTFYDYSYSVCSYETIADSIPVLESYYQHQKELLIKNLERSTECDKKLLRTVFKRNND